MIEDTKVIKMLEKFDEDFCHPFEDVISIKWAAPQTGWGEFVFFWKDKQLHCDSETMSKKFVKDRLCKMVDDCIFED